MSECSCNGHSPRPVVKWTMYGPPIPRVEWYCEDFYV